MIYFIVKSLLSRLESTLIFSFRVQTLFQKGKISEDSDEAAYPATGKIQALLGD
jgi:hypothetical protein